MYRALRGAVLLAAAIYLALAFFDAVARTLLLFFVAFLLAVALNIPVRALERRARIPRPVSVAGVAFALLGALVAAGAFALPPLAKQAEALARRAPREAERLQSRADALLRPYPALRRTLARASTAGGGSGGLLRRAGRFTLGVLSAPLALLAALVIALYAVAAPRPLLRGLLDAVPPRARPRAERAASRIVAQLEAWVRATLLLMLLVGTATGLGLWALGVPNPVLFGLLAGLGEAVPTVGPIVSALPPIAVTLADDPTKALWVALLFLAVQQVENALLVPLVLGKAVRLHPVSILLAVVLLGALVGILGALLAVPVALIVKALWDEFYLQPRAPADTAP